MLSMNCILCEIGMGSMREATRRDISVTSHNIACLQGNCMICLLDGFSARDCISEENPNMKKTGCRWCFLQPVPEERVRNGYWTTTHKFRILEYCLSQNLILFASASWTIPKYSTEIIARIGKRASIEMTRDSKQVSSS